MVSRGTSQTSSAHVSTLGVCWVAYGVARLGMAVWLAVFTSTAVVMFGALLTRVPDPSNLMAAFRIIYAVVIAWSVLCGIAGILAGLAMVSARPVARSLGLLAAFLSVSEIPLGTTLGICTFVALLPVKATEFSNARSQ